jgi:hypothetical protein
MTVGRAFGQDRRANHSAGPRTILDDDVLFQTLRELGRKITSESV